jgi:hypothetical protein
VRIVNNLFFVMHTPSVQTHVSGAVGACNSQNPDSKRDAGLRSCRNPAVSFSLQDVLL